MSRRVVWLQLLIGWTPVWVLLTAVVAMAHGVSWNSAVFVSLRTIVAAALVGLLVQRAINRLPWPRPMRFSFVLVHLALAIAYAVTWIALASLIESLVHWRLAIVVGPGFGPFLLTGAWLYVMVAGVSYTTASGERAAQAEANAARAQLAALRSQLNPHFLFNALHTVVQLIPHAPAKAADAAEQLAGLLRVGIEEDRDLVSVGDEWAFVSRYLDIERIRFGDRLRVQVEIDETARAFLIPVFALQTLVENAVRHAASVRVEPTDISITGRLEGRSVTFCVHDTGPGVSTEQLEGGTGTGLKRLRDRLAALYGAQAHLTFAREGGLGFAATLVIPAQAEAE